MTEDKGFRADMPERAENAGEGKSAPLRQRHLSALSFLPSIIGWDVAIHGADHDNMTALRMLYLWARRNRTYQEMTSRLHVGLFTA
jgi:hypothetical protein